MDWMKKDYVYMYSIYVHIYIVGIIATFKNISIEHMYGFNGHIFLNLPMHSIIGNFKNNMNTLL